MEPPLGDSSIASQPESFVRILDGYYPRPEKVREFALSCTFSEPFTGSWNGWQSLERAPDTRDVFFDLVRRLPETGTPNWEQIESSYRFWQRPSAGMFAFLPGGRSDTVHFHRRSGTWAGVCYLVPPQMAADRDGVAFFRHRETGATTSVGCSPEELAQFRSDGPFRERWERIRVVPMAFNRLVLFDGRAFHAASDGFGVTPREGRLTQLFNIDFLADPDNLSAEQR